MFGRKTWEKRFRDVGLELIKAAVAVNGLRIMDELPVVGISFDIDNPRAIEWIARKVFKFAYEVNQTTETQLRGALKTAITDGATITDIRKEVERIFGFAEKFRNERIARTETISATNYGAMEAIKQSGVTARKEWIATRDNRTRESHDTLDGEVVGMDETFSNGLQFPGDPESNDAAEIINCRCTIGYVFEGEE